MKGIEIIKSTKWREVFDQFNIGDVYQFNIDVKQKAGIMQVLQRMKSKGKKFKTNSLLSGGIEVKRVK